MEITMTTWTTESFGARATRAAAGTRLAPCAGPVEGTTVSVVGRFAIDRTRVVGPRGGYTPFIHKSIDVADPPHGTPPV